MRNVIGMTTAVVAAAALLLPVAAGAGAIHFSGDVSDLPTSWFMGDFACTGQPTAVAGSGLASGSYRVVETARLGAHVQLAGEATVDLYEAAGSPSDPQLGAYVGTWTYTAHQSEQYTPGGIGVFTGVAHGQIVFADGNTAMLKVSFTFVEGPDGPKVFLVNAACGGE